MWREGERERERAGGEGGEGGEGGREGGRRVREKERERENEYKVKGVLQRVEVLYYLRARVVVCIGRVMVEEGEKKH